MSHSSWIRAFRVEKPTRATLLIARHKLCVSPGLLMTGNMLLDLTSPVSNCIERMDVYGYEDNLTNPLTLHVSRGLQAGGSSVMV